MLIKFQTSLAADPVTRQMRRYVILRFVINHALCFEIVASLLSSAFYKAVYSNAFEV